MNTQGKQRKDNVGTTMSREVPTSQPERPKGLLSLTASTWTLNLPCTQP